jgi:hypothetical protein
MFLLIAVVAILLWYCRDPIVLKFYGLSHWDLTTICDVVARHPRVENKQIRFMEIPAWDRAEVTTDDVQEHGSPYRQKISLQKKDGAWSIVEIHVDDSEVDPKHWAEQVRHKKGLP